MSKVPIKIPFPAYKGDEDYVFISYAHADARIVYPELERLKRLGYNVWYDEGVSPGARWSDELALRIQNCSLFLVLFTPGLTKSAHCQDELNYVLEANRPVLAMHLTETELSPGLKLRLGARQAIFSYKLSNTEIDRKLNDVLTSIGLNRTEYHNKIAKFDLGPGDSIGNFHLLEVLGEGGMGTVFLAEQREPVARKVALKVIKLGMDTKEVLARFEAERQALALLAHPNVAAVYESGATSTGRPYFAMEYVPGVSITQYCDQNQLDFKARISLLKQACKGVLHAHQKGIIHRDLKSSNLLVNETTGSPIVKIIDFGIAKSMQGSLANLTLHTRLGAIVGSPGYASPEQMSGNPTDVDTRTDVYALGIVLYELLTGTRPFDDNTFVSRNGSEIHQLLRSTEAPLPVARLPQDETLAQAASMRAISATKIHKALRGDLSSIVMKAIRSKRDERYASVSSLVGDLDRWAIGAPIEARAQTPLYLASRLIKRHAASVTIGVSIFALLIGATITSTYSFLRANSEAERANTLATQSQTTVEFLLRLFEGSSPDNSPDPSLTARQLLDQGAARLKEDSDLDAGIKLQLSETVANVYLRLWLPQKAITLLRETISITVSELGENHILVLRARIKLGDVLRANNELKEAKQILESTKNQLDKTLGATIDDKARVLNNLALVLVRIGEPETAEPFYLEALNLRREEQGERSLSVAVNLHNLSLLYLSTQQLEKAEQYTRMSLDIRSELFESNHARIATSIDLLSSILSLQGNYSEAESLGRKALGIREAVFGPNNGLVARSLHNLARILIETGEWQASKDAFERAIKIDKSGTLDWAFHAYRLAFLETFMGQYERAQLLAEQALEIMQEKYDEDNKHVASLQTLLARLLLEQNQSITNAEQLARKAVNTALILNHEDHINVAHARLQLAEILNARGQSKIAISMAHKSLAVARTDTSVNKRFLASALATMARIQTFNDDESNACTFAQEYMEARLTYYASDHPYVTLAKQGINSCKDENYQ